METLVLFIYLFIYMLCFVLGKMHAYIRGFHPFPFSCVVTYKTLLYSYSFVMEYYFYVCAIVYCREIVSTSFDTFNKSKYTYERTNIYVSKHPWRLNVTYSVKWNISFEKIYSIVMLLQKKWQFIYFSFARMESPSGSVRTSAYALMAGWRYGFQRSG